MPEEEVEEEGSQAEVCDLLIVDDDDLLRWSLLEELRWAFPELQCLVKASPGEARQRMEHLGSVRVLLTDVHFPGNEQGGIELMRWLKEHRPGGRVILMSALECPLGPHEAHDLGLVHFLEKPFELDRLVDLLGELLFAS